MSAVEGHTVSTALTLRLQALTYHPRPAKFLFSHDRHFELRIFRRGEEKPVRFGIERHGFGAARSSPSPPQTIYRGFPRE
ncbi:hypothetical protein SBA1_170045 [Candidatus Sulfotelmatobacter kueseliae]|uniref:Uncharacterized protein n=1 Tax=Candidatus Sulfotelmatobacter kueseliae TaxID=2042962 RepID=A0A2U3KBL6_9BACT|nr:hypothetical protein SBA1_170045 [Candidatus Sulfotelmatobacter kueseliae]